MTARYSTIIAVGHDQSLCLSCQMTQAWLPAECINFLQLKPPLVQTPFHEALELVCKPSSLLYEHHIKSNGTLINFKRFFKS